MKKLATFAAILFMTGCATSGMKMSSDDNFESVASEAKAAIKKAASVDGEWRDSEKILNKAEKAAKAGDMKVALKLAKTAEFQGEMGYKQAMGQKNAGPWLF